jgi:hypothetical protein
MSKHNNANWDRYKLAGRERPGDAVLHEDARRRFPGAEDPANATAAGPHIPNQERASQPRSGGTVAAAQEQAASEDASETNAAPEDVAPRLTDDEGYTG